MAREGKNLDSSSQYPPQADKLLKRDENMAVDGIIGIKLGMTQVFTEDGNLVGVTVL